jgi:crossover junction endodeoxyribonuclease RuvC
LCFHNPRATLIAMTIMGLDPGFARVGWAIIQSDGSRVDARAFGCIETEKTTQPEVRLKEVFDATRTLLKTHKPDCVSIEELYFSNNAKTAIGVGQSRGVLLLAAATHHIPVVSYSPLTIKRAITGDGNADKKQVTRMIVLTLKLKEAPKLDDTADALAIAMTHAYSYRMHKKQL